MSSIHQLCEEVLAAWALGANVSVPDPDVRLYWKPQLVDLSKMVARGEITLEDIQDYARELSSEPWKRSHPQLWSLKFVRDHILVWIQTAERQRKSFPPPPTFKSHIDHLGRRHSWDWGRGCEVIVEPCDEPEPVPTTEHGASYIPLGPNERITKRYGREGFQRDFFLTGDDSGLTAEEERQLKELAGDDTAIW